MRGIAVDHYTSVAQEKMHGVVNEVAQKDLKAPRLLGLSVEIISLVIEVTGRVLSPIESVGCLGVNLLGSLFSKTCRGDVKDSLIRLALRVMRVVIHPLLILQGLLRCALYIFSSKDTVLRIISYCYNYHSYEQYLAAEYLTSSLSFQLTPPFVFGEKDEERVKIARQKLVFYKTHGWKARWKERAKSANPI